MSYGANEAVEIAEDEYREQCADLIALRAAALVAARDMGRAEAISVLAERLRTENEAGGDPSGIVSIENVFPSPSKVAPRDQIAAIASELKVAARDAAESL
jgi:hypothetical protein